MQHIETIQAPATSRLATPYHELGNADGPRIPGWAEHRSVYRGGGRTIYMVETKRLNRAARRDLTHLSEHGWQVTIERASGHQANTRVGLMRRPSSRPANRA